MSLEKSLKNDKKIRVLGFDDAPFTLESEVYIAGVICSNTRFEGVLWDSIVRDGSNATQVLIDLITKSKFHPMINVVLIDGLAMGGFNLVDLPLLSEKIELPCVAVMRRMPNLTKFSAALDNFEDAEQRKQIVAKAGPIHHLQGFYFQSVGAEAPVIAKVLQKITDTGKVPEALRIAHLIGSAIMTGQSSNRA